MMNKTSIAITGYGLVLPKRAEQLAEQEQTRPDLIPRRLKRFSSRSIPAAVDACRQALDASGLDENTLSEKAALYTAQSGFQHPDFDDFAEALRDWDRHGDTSLVARLWQSRQVNPFLITRGLSNNVVGIISQIWQLKNDGVAFIRDQAGSAAALDEACFQLRSGYAQLAIVVMSGCEQDCYSAVAEQKSFPGHDEASGAAVLVLESKAHAVERGANVKAWINGFNQNSASNHQQNNSFLQTKDAQGGPLLQLQSELEWAGIVMAIVQSLQHLTADNFQGQWSVEANNGKGRTARATLKRDTQ